jgi:hypothetical protein
VRVGALLLVPGVPLVPLLLEVAVLDAHGSTISHLCSGIWVGV